MKVFIRRANHKTTHEVLGSLLEEVGLPSMLANQQYERVALKLNLSSIQPETQAASNTDNLITSGIVDFIHSHTKKDVLLVESDGMRYTAEEAFEQNGIYELAAKHNAQVVNLSKTEQQHGLIPEMEEFGLPSLLLDSKTLFITLPVLKTHALTVFTGALKNQWGCVPEYNRILLHKHIHELLPKINKLLRPQLAIMDGILGMEGRGPTSGKPRHLGVVLVSRYPASIDATAMRLVGLDPYTSKHIALAQSDELGPIDKDQIEIDGDFEALKTQFEPANLDWAVYWMNELSRFPFFVHKILLNPWIFLAGKKAVVSLRAVGIVR